MAGEPHYRVSEHDRALRSHAKAWERMHAARGTEAWSELRQDVVDHMHEIRRISSRRKARS